MPSLVILYNYVLPPILKVMFPNHFALLLRYTSHLKMPVPFTKEECGCVSPAEGRPLK